MLSVRDIDRGKYKELKQRVLEARRRKVTIGIHASDQARDSEDGGPTNLEIGTAHEFGTESLPERSFIRVTIDEHQKRYAEIVTKLLGAVVDGKMTVDRGLRLFGEVIRADIIQRFNNNEIRPDISEQRKKEKGSSTVLIDTGSLKQSIDYEVVK